MISHECASCTLPYGLKLDYIMETVPSVQFRSWSLDINVEALALPHGHDLDGISALVVPIRGLMSHSADLGDTRISVRDKMCQEFSRNVGGYVAAESRTTTSIWCTGLAFSPFA